MPTISGFSRAIATAIIPGAAAGVHAVPGEIADGDTLIAVTRLTDATPPVPTDLTAEFSIPAGTQGQISNALGTATTGAFLVVSWVKAN